MKLHIQAGGAKSPNTKMIKTEKEVRKCISFGLKKAPKTPKGEYTYSTLSCISSNPAFCVFLLPCR